MQPPWYSASGTPMIVFNRILTKRSSFTCFTLFTYKVMMSSPNISSGSSEIYLISWYEYFGFQVSSFILHNNALQCNRINKTEKLIGAYSPPNIHLFLLSTYLMESSNIQIYHTYILTSPLRCVLCVPQFWHRCIHNME